MPMDLSFDEIVSVAGKGGLFKILKPTKNGYIVEEMSDSRKKLVIGPNHRVSLLKEISIYTTDNEGAIPLRDVYSKVLEKYNKELPVSPKDDSEDLFSFLGEVVPEFDAERVYHSDVKKLVSWYGIIMKEAPEISFEEVGENADSDSKDEEKPEGAKPKTSPKKGSSSKSASAKAPKANKQVSSAKKGASKPSASRKMG
jgi:hypothetical protein